ncbi:M23 family metallopeptidase [Pseudoxanthomonas sp.]|uniref:M23 family metallopeptidase n=1 Tax=Pseudoxanthomonas sp. TaxID=1871049 RepID=UPI00258BBFFD|nr:M23 family metallopeptidase [Pseudoxanthomonas sp.]MCR6686329.1 M23 family metallopeptidase [Pseudoxanthomonas sp.]
MKLLLALLLCVLVALGALVFLAGGPGAGALVEVAPSVQAPPGTISTHKATPAQGSATDPDIAAPAAGARPDPAVPAAAGDPHAAASPAPPDTTAPAPASAPSPVVATDGRTSPLLLPVQGIRPGQLHDTFNDARSEGRRHDAIDIMAAAGTPVLAVADGHVEKLFDSERGGLTIYQFEPSGRLAYYYAHLQRYADGLAEGQPLRRGQVIGYVGATGNASPDAPHLHFAIFVLGPERRWWEGTAVNPYPVLRGEAPLP